jgi:hypothetical protein
MANGNGNNSSGSGNSSNSNSSGNSSSDNDNVAELTANMNVKLSINEQVLQCIPGVGSIVSAVLAEKKVSLLAIYMGDFNEDDIAMMKYPSGKVIGAARAEKIVKGARSIVVDDTKKAKDARIKLLSTIPRISKRIAMIILQNTSLKLILEGTVDAEMLSNIEKPGNGSGKTSRLGAKTAENIIEYLINNAVRMPKKEPVDKPEEPKKPVKKIIRMKKRVVQNSTVL